MSTQENRGQKWVFWMIIVLGMLLIVNLSRGIWSLLKARDRIREAEERLAQLVAQKKELEKQVQYQLSEGYAEKEIRDKLSMAKPGEVVVILPEIMQQATGDTLQAKERDSKTTEAQPNWRKWLGVLGL